MHDMFNCLKAKEDADRNLLTENYVKNHFPHIVFRLASLDRDLGYAPGTYLNSEQVYNTLKGRYEREILRFDRPAIRKVLNRDSAAGLCMTLSVCSVISKGTSTSTNLGSPGQHRYAAQSPPQYLELTDGWYRIHATLDKVLSSRVLEGKIKVGSKLTFSGAILDGVEEGVDPLDSGYSSLEKPSATLKVRSCE